MKTVVLINIKTMGIHVVRTRERNVGKPSDAEKRVDGANGGSVLAEASQSDN
jgi:hypothetical protein